MDVPVDTRRGTPSRDNGSARAGARHELQPWVLRVEPNTLHTVPALNAANNQNVLAIKAGTARRVQKVRRSKYNGDPGTNGWS